MTTREGLTLLRAAADTYGWTRHKLLSLRGQFLKLETDDQRAGFMRQVLRDTVDVELLREAAKW